MVQLRPLEFCDCVVDGPHFRSALYIHEKELKKFSKRVKDVYTTAERVFKAMDRKFHLVVLTIEFGEQCVTKFLVVSSPPFCPLFFGM